MAPAAPLVAPTATPLLILIATLVVSTGKTTQPTPTTVGPAVEHEMMSSNSNDAKGSSDPFPLHNSSLSHMQRQATGSSVWPLDPWWAWQVRRAHRRHAPDPKSPRHACMGSDWSSSAAAAAAASEALSVGGGVSWSRRVCSSTALDARVRALLAASPCPRHRVCQTLSPRDLQQIGSDESCEREVRHKWWHRFHAIRSQLREFDAFVLNAFNMRDFSVSHHVQHCKAAYTFWKCSMALPLYLTPYASRTSSSSSSSQTSTSRSSSRSPLTSSSWSSSWSSWSSETRRESVRVEGCDSICKEVERACPFLIMGFEEDMAGGNPAFTCKDESMPTVLEDSSIPSPCCYQAVHDPAPGSWLSINGSNGEPLPFCIEPDTIDSKETDEHNKERPALAPAPPEAALSCRVLAAPSADLSITGVPADVWRAWRHHLNTSDADLDHHFFARWGDYPDGPDGAPGPPGGGPGGQLFASITTWWRALRISVGMSGGVASAPDVRVVAVVVVVRLLAADGRALRLI